MYQVKEVYYTLQGEGAHTGRPAVFLRFAGCNLWSGREADRQSAVCRFCDTDFVGTDGINGGKYPTASELAEVVDATWQWKAESNGTRPFVVCTGGEPLLQLDELLIRELHLRGFQIAVETNGTIEAPQGIDWICCSPKAGADLLLHRGQEFKLVFPQENLDPADFVHLEFDQFYIQPMDGPELEQNTKLAIEYCEKHPRWNLSIQTHKILGLR